MHNRVIPFNLKSSAERWIMLLIASMPLFGMSFAQFSLSSFSIEFIGSFHVSNTQFSAVTLVYFLALGSIGAIGGLLADKYGMRRVMIIAAVFSSASAILRLFTASFILFFILSFVAGALSGVAYGISGKIISMWFPEKLSVIAFGIFAVSGALGTSIPQFMSGVMNSYKEGMLIGGIVLAADGILWILFGKDHPLGYEKQPALPFFRYFGKVLKVRQVWIISFALICFAGELLGATVLIPRFLMIERGLQISQANWITGFLNIAALAGSIVIPQLQSRMGRTKLFIIIMSVMEIFSLALLTVAGNELLWAVVFSFGFFISCIDAFLMSLLTGTEAIGSEYMGTASGFVSMLRFIVGGFAVPTFIITPLVDIAPILLIISVGTLCVIQIILTLIIKK